MPSLPVEPVLAETLYSEGLIRYSICTLVTRLDQYKDMVDSFRRLGFDSDDCEYLYIDNSTANGMDGYSGLNLFLSVARGQRIIICHQDVLLMGDGRQKLDEVLAQLDEQDPTWAVSGNSGGVSPGRLALRITDPHGADQKTRALPARVSGLDENFLVVKRHANLALSHDLSGFHLYATDLCIIADVLGWSSYVIDFHLRHLSPGVRDESLARSREALIAKYSRAFRRRWVTTPCETVFLSGTLLLAKSLSSKLVTRLLYHIGKRLRS